ncbi:MAG: hypothetical protein M1839_005842 [Geoglossum umbratile]|nr:MAG: hypothetical protein M1839_005842 [Geoglossum umbratile]
MTSFERQLNPEMAVMCLHYFGVLGAAKSDGVTMGAYRATGTLSSEHSGYLYPKPAVLDLNGDTNGLRPAISIGDGVDNVGNGMSNNAVSHSDINTIEINSGSFGGILSGNIIDSFSGNSINFYSNNNNDYFAKICDSCDIVRVDRNCNCFATQNCPTCPVIVKPITFNTTAHLTISIAPGTATMAPVAHVSGKVGFNICPNGQCFAVADKAAPFRNLTGDFNDVPNATGAFLRPTGTPRPITPGHNTPVPSHGSSPAIRVPIVGLAIALSFAILL